METIEQGNSRLLYTKQIVENIDIADAIAPIDELVHHSTKLQLASDKIIIEFSMSPEEYDFKKSQILIGRKILGYDSDVFAQIMYKDYNSKKVTQIPLNLHSNWNDFFEEAKEHVYNKKSWRLLIEDNFSKTILEY